MLDKLRIKAVAKLREFILQKVYACRKPMSNYQVSQNTLLKYRLESTNIFAVFDFLPIHSDVFRIKINANFFRALRYLLIFYYGRTPICGNHSKTNRLAGSYVMKYFELQKRNVERNYGPIFIT